MYLEGKKGLIIGLANSYSIAWSIAQEARAQGAELGFTYLNEAIEKRMRPLAEQLNGSFILPCDVNSDEQVEALFTAVKEKWGKLDFLVHAVAYAEREDLMGSFAATSRKGFITAMETSVYSLITLSNHAAPLMNEGGSILTLTYYGAEKSVKNYNIMGAAKAALEASVRYLAADLGEKNIRVNAISAGAIKTLSAKGIHGFNDILGVYREKAPLRRATDPAEVGKASAFLLSDAASGITGEVLHVDSGFNSVGY